MFGTFGLATYSTPIQCTLKTAVQQNADVRSQGLVDRYHRDEAKKTLLCKNVLSYSNWINNVDKSIVEKIMSLIERNRFLWTERNSRLVAISLIVIVLKLNNRVVIMKDVKKSTGVKNLNKHVRKLCTRLKISLTSLCVNSIPAICDQFELLYSGQLKVHKAFVKLTKLNPSIGQESLLALVLLLYIDRDSYTVDQVARAASTSECSLSLYLKGKKKVIGLQIQSKT